MVGKGPRRPKPIATIAFCDPIFHPLSLLLGRDPCGDMILRSCLQKGPATTPANYEDDTICYPKKVSGSNWHSEFHLGYTRNFLGNELCNPRGPNGICLSFLSYSCSLNFRECATFPYDRVFAKSSTPAGVLYKNPAQRQQRLGWLDVP